MLTPWGDLPVRDAHVHFFSQTFFASLAIQSGKPLAQLGGLLGWEIPPEDPRALAERWVGELDRHGVERASIIASLHGDAESVAAALVHSPGRFHGYFMLDPTAGDAAEHLESALAWGLRGICLFPAMHRYSLHDKRVCPVFDAAAATSGALVFVHCGVLTVGVRKKLGLASPFDMRFSNPIDVHAIALRYPGLNFVIPHFGAGYFREALMVAALCPNVHLDTSSSNSLDPLRRSSLGSAGRFPPRAGRGRPRAACCSAPTPRSSRAAGTARFSTSNRGCCTKSAYRARTRP